jgi:hypothetical protein
MYSLIWPLIAILMRPSTWTYLMTPLYFSGRNLVRASGVLVQVVVLVEQMVGPSYLADPHVQVGLVAADGGPLTRSLQISLPLAKVFTLTGVRIPAERARELGLANHVVADPFADALACAPKPPNRSPSRRRNGC